MHRVWIVICLSVAAATIAVASLNSTEHEFEEELFTINRTIGKPILKEGDKVIKDSKQNSNI